MVAQLEGIGLAILADGPALRCAGDRLTILAVGQQAEEHIVGQAAGLHCGDVVRVHRLWFAVIADAQHLLGLSGTAYRERSEEHTSELQSLMRISYAVFCLKKKKNKSRLRHQDTHTSVQHKSARQMTQVML